MAKRKAQEVNVKQPDRREGMPERTDVRSTEEAKKRVDEILRKLREQARQELADSQ